MPASEHPDAWLWVLIVGISYYATWAIRKQLILVRDAVRITKPEKSPGMVSQDTEDAIKLETLGQLAESPSIEIREASIRILTQRALKPGPAWDHLLEQLASEKASKRSKALLTLRFIMPERPLPQYSSYQFWQPNFLSAIVASLGKLIPGVHLAFVEQKYPSDDQVIALEILSILLYDISDSNLQRLCDAGLITEWLARYPFLKDAPADRPKTEAKAEAVRNFVKWSEGEPCHTPDMRDILILLLTKQSVRAQLVDAGIWSFKFDHQDEKERMRHVEESPEEVQLRRRRREAVVIGEEGRAITRRDIYQRGDDIGEEGVEDQLEHLWEVEEAVRRDNASHRGFWDIVRRLRPDGLSPQ